MSTEDNKELIRCYTEEVFNGHNPDRTGEFVTIAVIAHDIPLECPLALRDSSR